MSLITNWGEVALEEYKKGASDAEVITSLNITRSKFNNLLSEDPEFAEVMEFGRDLAKAFWYRLARENLTNKNFQTTLWYHVMVNRYGWSSKNTTIESTPLQEKSDDELRQEVEQLLNKHQRMDTGTAKAK